MRDPTSFDQFYQASVQRLTSQLFAMTGDRAEAEDSVQEAFARAWQHWGKVSGYADPEGWVRTVAWRISVSAFRKAVSRSRAQRRLGPPDEMAGLSPDYVAIIAALRQIPAPQRQAVVLHHLVGLPVEEIARQGQLPVGTVKARLARGRRALALLLVDGPVVDGPAQAETDSAPTAGQRGEGVNAGA